MKIFPYNDVKAKKYGNSYEPLKDSVIIIIVGILLLIFSSIISFEYNLLILTIITLVILIVGVILATIGFTSKRNIDLSALVIDDNKLLIIKVNPLAKKKDLDNLKDKYNMDINKVNKKRYDDLFVKNIKNLEFWLLCSLVFTFLIISFKLTIPFICTIPFYAEIMTFALTLSCYDPANDTNYVGSSKPQNYIKIAIASFIVSLLVCFVWR